MSGDGGEAQRLVQQQVRLGWAGQILGGELQGGEEDEGEEGLDMSTMLSSMKYKYHFKFAQPLGQTKAAEGVLVEPDGTKEVAFSTDFSLISKDPKALDLRLELVK